MWYGGQDFFFSLPSPDFNNQCGTRCCCSLEIKKKKKSVEEGVWCKAMCTGEKVEGVEVQMWRLTVRKRAMMDNRMSAT